MSTNASFGIIVCGFCSRAPVLKHEWIINCTTPTRFLGKRVDVTHRSNFTSSASVGFRIHSKFQDTVQLCRNRPFPKIQTIPTDWIIFIDNAICGAFLLINYSINAPYSLFLLVRLLPLTSLLPRGETLFLFPLIIILEFTPHSKFIPRQFQTLS